jgi:CRISPR/Cas system-associated exonuclease Cas4 (RecB family)
VNNDIASIIPQDSETVKAIYDFHKRQGDAEIQRGYLGASQIGHECERYLWYGFRFCVPKTFDGRMYRLFETGDLEEPRMVEELRAIGCEVHDKDEHGQQFEAKALGGHFALHVDGIVIGVLEAPKTWHVLECKTHNAKSFQSLKTKGLKQSKPKHYAQTMSCMSLMKLTRALYLAKNKDTDELWSDRVRYDAHESQLLMDKAERIIRAIEPAEQCANRPDDFRCKFCECFDLCWGTGSVAVPLPGRTCRTCCHATPEIDEGETWARWSCAALQKDLRLEEQRVGCPGHLLIPHLVSFAVPHDSGSDWIEFKNIKDGAIWRHGAGSGEWSTEELLRTPGPVIGEKAVESVKAVLGGTYLGMEEKEMSLVEKYPPEDSRLLWESDVVDNDAIEAALASILPEGHSTANFSAKSEDDQHLAVQYLDKILLVIYKESDYVAIFEGKE